MMVLNIKYDIHLACKIIVQELLDKLEVPYKITGLGEIEIDGAVSSEKYAELESSLKKYGIEIVLNPKYVLVQKIKDAIIETVYWEDKFLTKNFSYYLADKLNYSYTYLANIFTEVTYSTIANFIILQKIERAKQMIIDGELNLTEIAFALNYSSVAHLSNQFKNITGLSPGAFQRIIKKRKIFEL